MTTSAATPSHTPCAWEHHPHSQQRPAPSRSTTARTPASVGQPLPPSLRPNDARSPIAQDARSPSPNYFGLAFESSADVFSSSGARHARANWSPPNSNVRSTAAASPRVIPVDQNPEFEAFRRQSEEARKFSLGGGLSQFTIAKPPMNLSNPPSARSVSQLDSPSSHQNGTPISPKSSDSSSSILTPEKPRSPKRMLSSDSSVFPNRPRRLSPASYSEASDSEPPKFAEGVPDRLSMPAGRLGSNFSTHSRAETLPANLDTEGHDPKQGPVMVTPQHVVTLLESSEEEILLLDLRVSTQYSISRLRGALNLCIPTTLLKRPSFNVEKLAETFHDEGQRKKFENWRSCRYIVVYDADSSQLKDATSCVNTLKKFSHEGWNGPSYIIRGGLIEFASKFPSFISNGTSSPKAAITSKKPNLRLDSLPGPAPVIGGCPMPATQNAANPFFGNIRQNMDLIGGVGQMPVKRPTRMNSSTHRELPGWLKAAADEKDNGASVSDKFLQIEKREQKRMQEALSGKVVYGEPGPEVQKAVQIAGIEKGSKNRYNNIWPFEHTRVKLQGVPMEGCDYVNANHVKPPWSNKRYIATQGPIPVTFADFWSVIWQQDVRVIVMLTAEKEGGQIKAHNYWDAQQYGPYRLHFHTEHRASLELGTIKRHHARSSTGHTGSSGSSSQDSFPFGDSHGGSPSSDQPYVIVRKFTLQNTELPFARMREITQLQYSNWPDFGAPAHPTHLLGLVEQCDAVVRQTQSSSVDEPDPPNRHPVLVHCSAGCGRTGTFCTVDSVIDMLKRQRTARFRRDTSPMEVDKTPPKSTQANPFFPNNSVESEVDENDESWIHRDDIDLIEKTVETFRHQRLSMVQSLRQFVLCYESVLEWLVEQHQS